MSFVPTEVNAQFATIHNRKDYSVVQDLWYPDHKRQIGRLSLSEMQVWYAAQDPHTLIEANKDFQRFWFWHYVLPLRVKRALFWFKFW